MHYIKKKVFILMPDAFRECKVPSSGAYLKPKTKYQWLNIHYVQPTTLCALWVLVYHCWSLTTLSCRQYLIKSRLVECTISHVC